MPQVFVALGTGAGAVGNCMAPAQSRLVKSQRRWEGRRPRRPPRDEKGRQASAREPRSLPGHIEIVKIRVTGASSGSSELGILRIED